MDAVIQDRGHQYRAVAGDRLTIDRSTAEVGATVEMPVLLIADDAGVKVGSPFVAGAKAVLKVVQHKRGEKVIIGKYKRRKHSVKRRGFRADLTVVEVVSISG
jgi:large subunit ribosomal protein L21